MKNLEQIRAANAFKHKDHKISGKEGGNVVKKIPPMIRENGILSTLAFALEKKSGEKLKNEGHFEVFKIITEHLQSKDIKQKSWNFSPNPESFMKYLSGEASSVELRAITAEALVFLNYLRRFVKKENNDSTNED